MSNTSKTFARRMLRQAKAGRADARARAKASTPAFPLHPAGYPADAPDARPAKPTSTDPASSAS